MMHVRRMGVLALAVAMVGTAACSGNDRVRGFPGTYRPSVGERSGQGGARGHRDRDDDGEKDKKDKRNRGNRGNGNGRGNGRGNP